MSYYDFDDHFWAPYEVCGQKSEIVTQEEYFSIIGKLYSWLRGVRHSSIETLEIAYKKRWILSTSQLAPLLKLTSKTVIRYKSFERNGFTFTRLEQLGAEIGWRVGKADL